MSQESLAQSERRGEKSARPHHEEPDWGQVAQRLTLYAWRRLRRVGIEDHALSEDMAIEAITRALDERYVSWNPEVYQTFALFLQSVVNGLVRNHIRLLATTREARVDPHTLASRVDARRSSGEGDAMAREQRARRAVGMLREKFDGDALLDRVLTLTLQGIGRPADMATVLEVDVREVYNANRRLKRHAMQLRCELEQAAREGEQG